jgi:hypothetical protein
VDASAAFASVSAFGPTTASVVREAATGGLLKTVSLYILLFLAGFAHGFLSAENAADETTRREISTAAAENVESYEQALQVWKTPQNINAWIASNFSYDPRRSMRLSETQVAQQGQPAIFTPSQFFSVKSGTCVDLSRFAVETLKIINPQYDAKYLTIEFDPITINGNVLRRHWLVSFKRDGRTYFFADSNRPGLIAGPFNGPEEFIREYERYRGRRVVAYRETESYHKHRRVRILKRKAPLRNEQRAGPNVWHSLP